MKASELRIGNYINEPNNEDTKPFQIWGLYHEPRNEKINNYPIALFKPIPLTEEWLLKFGFEKHHKEYYISNIIMLKLLCIREDGGGGFIRNEYDFALYPRDLGSASYPNAIPLEHVHQLQNLYFALTGEELEIKED